MLQPQQQGMQGHSGHPQQPENQQLLQNSQLMQNSQFVQNPQLLQNSQLMANSQLGYYIPQQQQQQQQQLQQLTPHQQQETYQQNWQLGQTLSQQPPLNLSSGLTYVGASPEVESALKAAHEAYRKSEFMQALQLCHAVRTCHEDAWICSQVSCESVTQQHLWSVYALWKLTGPAPPCCALQYEGCGIASHSFFSAWEVAV